MKLIFKNYIFSFFDKNLIFNFLSKKNLLFLILLTSCGTSGNPDDLVNPSLVKESDYSKQVEFLTEAIKDYPDEPHYYYLRSKLYYEADRNSQALRDANAAINFDRNQPKYYFLLSQILLKKGENKAALQAAEKAKLLGFNELYLDKQLGVCHYLAGDKDAAMKYLQIFNNVMPDEIEVLYYLGAVYADYDDSLNACRYLDEVLVKNKSNSEAYVRLIGLHNSRRNPYRANQYAKEALQYCPPKPAIYLQTARTLDMMRRYDSAAVWYNKTLALDARQWEAYYRMAINSMRKEEFRAAESYYKTALQIKKDIPNGYLQLGVLYEYRLENLNEAKATYEKGVEVFPTDSTLIKSIWRAKWKLKKKAEEWINAHQPSQQNTESTQ